MTSRVESCSPAGMSDRHMVARNARIDSRIGAQDRTQATIDTAAALAALDEVNGDIHASEEYRRAMLRVFTRRALEAALARV